MSFIAPAARPISAEERRNRIEALAARLQAEGLAALLLGSTNSLRYFTGLDWHPSERLTGALIHADGRVEYVCPRFELDKVGGLTSAETAVPGEILTWEEEESPYALVAGRLPAGGRLITQGLTGSGGFARTMPRLPSMLSSIAVSSPHT